MVLRVLSTMETSESDPLANEVPWEPLNLIYSEELRILIFRFSLLVKTCRLLLVYSTQSLIDDRDVRIGSDPPANELLPIPVRQLIISRMKNEMGAVRGGREQRRTLCRVRHFRSTSFAIVSIPSEYLSARVYQSRGESNLPRNAAGSIPLVSSGAISSALPSVAHSSRWNVFLSVAEQFTGKNLFSPASRL